MLVLHAGCYSLADWRMSMSSPACRARMDEEQAFMHASGRTFGFFCKGRPVLYSPSRRFAYMKTPKGASLAIQDLFQRQFPDYRWAEAREELPNGTITFTFVREPVHRAMSAYAEIDVSYALRATEPARLQMCTAFHRMKRQPAYAPRLLAFLDDLMEHRFGGEDREHWMPTHAYPQMNFMCAHRVDFIGHLENQDADWDTAQALANIPVAERTSFPHGHAADNRTGAATGNHSGEAICNRACQLKQMLSILPPGSHVLQRLCDVFASDFLCLGYPLPTSCSLLRDEDDLALNGVLPMPRKQDERAAPVYLLRDLDANGARQMIEAPRYHNTLFVVGFVAVPVVENCSSSTLIHLKRAANASFSPPKSSAGLLLRAYDNFGWLFSNGTDQRTSSPAPLALGVPLPPDRRTPQSQRDAAAWEHVERAMSDGARMLLLHRYDRVVVAGRGLLTEDDGKANIFTAPVSDLVARWLVNPLSTANAFSASRRGPHAPGPGGSGGRESGAPAHKHFLPG